MTCDYEPIRNDIEHRCQLRKGHKGMCKATIEISWWGKKSGVGLEAKK
jgi:hypothetical protein